MKTSAKCLEGEWGTASDRAHEDSLENGSEHNMSQCTTCLKIQIHMPYKQHQIEALSFDSD